MLSKIVLALAVVAGASATYHTTDESKQKVSAPATTAESRPFGTRSTSHA